MNFASKLRETVDDLIRNYISTDGVGPDAYCESVRNHPMAEGKYLLALGELYRSQLVDPNDLQQQVIGACHRLYDKKISIDGGIGWGLGFSWRDLPPTEPYLITTAIVLHGLGSLAELQTPNMQLTRLLHQGLGGLAEWVRKQTAPHPDLSIELPIFSPGIAEPVLNSAAYALYVLKQYAPDADLRIRTGKMLDAVANLRTEDIGWEYSPSARIVDLIHQSYLLNVLFDSDCKRIEQQFVELVRLFDSVGGYADKCKILGSKPPEMSSDVLLLRRVGDLYVDVARKPARLWSLGELLVGMSKVAGKSANRAAWKRRAHAVAEAILEHCKQPSREAQYPRHAMHAAHGLAAYLAFLREQNRESTAKTIEHETCNTTIAL